MSNRRKLPSEKARRLRCPKCRRKDDLRRKGDTNVCMHCGHTWPVVQTPVTPVHLHPLGEYMKFVYDHDIPTVEQVMRQVVVAWSGDPKSNPLTEEYLTSWIEKTAAAGLAEIRGILTAELSALFDVEHSAVEWNQAVEQCIQVVEATR